MLERTLSGCSRRFVRRFYNKGAFILANRLSAGFERVNQVVGKMLKSTA